MTPLKCGIAAHYAYDDGGAEVGVTFATPFCLDEIRQRN